MRGVVAPLLAVFLVFTAAGAWADETQTPPTDPPGARMKPPDGVTAQARLNPPSGVTVQARMNPPVGAPMTLKEMILLWLQSRLTIPHG